MTTEEILEKVKTGAMSIEKATALLKEQPFEDLGFAKPRGVSERAFRKSSTARGRRIRS